MRSGRIDCVGPVRRRVKERVGNYGLMHMAGGRGGKKESGGGKRCDAEDEPESAAGKF
jgi:hypothetical protein